MSGLTLEGISKRFGSVTAVDGVSLEVPHGTFVCLLGPSGCGKTTLLRMIAGLEDASEGRILLDGIDMTTVPTHKRDFGMVFQSLALAAGKLADPEPLIRRAPGTRAPRPEASVVYAGECAEGAAVSEQR